MLSMSMSMSMSKAHNSRTMGCSHLATAAQFVLP
jgi:hypothetical protein